VVPLNTHIKGNFSVHVATPLQHDMEYRLRDPGLARRSAHGSPPFSCPGRGTHAGVQQAAAAAATQWQSSGEY